MHFGAKPTTKPPISYRGMMPRPKMYQIWVIFALKGSTNSCAKNRSSDQRMVLVHLIISNLLGEMKGQFRYNHNQIK
jgi:hypothetical protein